LTGLSANLLDNSGSKWVQSSLDKSPLRLCRQRVLRKGLIFRNSLNLPQAFLYMMLKLEFIFNEWSIWTPRYLYVAVALINSYQLISECYFQRLRLLCQVLGSTKHHWFCFAWISIQDQFISTHHSAIAFTSYESLSSMIKVWHLIRQDEKSLKKTMKRRGPRIDPLGTPDVTFPVADKQSLYSIWCVRLKR
jgi:hypothetical protein